MNNTTHTPGPWYPHYAKADHCLSSSVWGKEPGNQVAVIGGKSLETMNANAALIAAAPAMYQAGKLSLDVMERVATALGRMGNEGLRSIVRSAIIEQKTALAQAEGHQHG